MLVELHPKVAFRDCRDCMLHVYDEEKGERKIWGATGKPLRRPKRVGPPCAYGKCPKGKPDDCSELVQLNWRVYKHYQQCKAVGRFEEDEIVERNAGVIADVERVVEKRDKAELRELLMRVAVR